VGLPCPDYVVKTSLGEAYDIWRKNFADAMAMGAVMIPERHAILKDEQIRILDKVSGGVSFFISQCVFDVNYARQVLVDLVHATKERETEIPTIIFTLTICGSAKTLQFMEWLGIYIPEQIKKDLIGSENQVRRSVEIATSIAKELIECCEQLEIPFGFNIESVAIRKEEIEASYDVLQMVDQMLKEKGLRVKTDTTLVQGVVNS
jgi:5,10-methylenetetrahydrofolate reductase